MYGSTEVILFPIGGRDDRVKAARPRTATARPTWSASPSTKMSAARRVTARRNNELISQLNLQARIETQEDGWYW